MTDEKNPADEAETETADATPAVETLPDDDSSAIVEPETGADPAVETDAADIPDEAAPPADDSDQEQPPAVFDEQAVPEIDEDGEEVHRSPKTGKPLSGAALAAAKKKADAARREATIAEVAAETPEPSEAVLAEDERRNVIADKLIEIDDEVQEIDARAAKLRKKQGKLMLELYPPAAGNDLLSTAVKGYLAASQRERTHRALAPQRMKAMLKQMGLSPIDAAMQRKAARGMQRPRRKMAKQAAAPGQEQAPGGTPDKTVEPTE